MSDGGKGHAPRPFNIPKEEFAEKWNSIFGDKPILKGYCNICNKKESWCECKYHQPVAKAVEEAIDKALFGLEKRKKK